MEGSSTNRPLVMIVEDNPLIVEFVERHLHRHDFQVVVAEGYQDAVTLLQQQPPDLLLVDLVLDDGKGYDLCRYIRNGGDGELARLADVPIVIMTALAEESYRIQGFEAGADDYVIKPFSAEELVYRIKAILRRSSGVSAALVELGPLSVDPRLHAASVAGAPVELTPKEFDLLHLLASCPGRVFGREELLGRVWGYSFAGNTRTVDVHVNRLRQKLVAHGLPEDLISTEWGVGYKLEPPADLEARELGGG
ncbi:MAG TPA: response regulator transcription factor [Roseiflexaceae bacterium]|nr:response regulator transcription factor [Roseiflexaceae bacterium]